MVLSEALALQAQYYADAKASLQQADAVMGVVGQVIGEGRTTLSDAEAASITPPVVVVVDARAEILGRLTAFVATL